MTPRPLIAALSILIATTVAIPARAADPLCHKYETGANAVLVIVDRTSPLGDGRKKQAAEEGLKFALDSLIPGDLLIVTTVEETAVTRKHIFRDCWPGRERSLFKRPLDPVILDTDQTSFRAQLNGAFAKDLKENRSTKSRSPILDTLAVATRNLQNVRVKSLILVSDLIERDVVTLDPLTPLNEQRIRDVMDVVQTKKLLANLNKAAVHVFGFGFEDMNEKPLSTDMRESLAEFWRRYFQRSGAELIDIRR